jgi:2-aminoadipate transaminase
MLEQMQRYFPHEVTWNRPQGGFFIFVQIPGDMDAADLFRQAVAKNVAFVTGQSFFVDGSGHNTLRLSYAQAGHQDIEFAIRKIGNLIKAHIIGRKTNNAA